MLHQRVRTLAVDTPDFLQDGLEADAVFIYRPQLNTRPWECRRRLAQQWTQTHLNSGLRHRIGLDMTGTRLEQTRADLPEGAPTSLATGDATDTSAQPLCHCPSTPVVAIWMGLGERLAERSLLCGVEREALLCWQRAPPPSRMRRTPWKTSSRNISPF